MQHLPGYKQACKVLEKHLSSRARDLQVLEAYAEGTQYAGRPDFFSSKRPLWERAPCIVYPIVKTAIDSNSDLLLGEGRFPAVNIDGLAGDVAETFENAVRDVMKQSRFQAAAREMFYASQACGSACAIVGVRKQRLFIETVFARWCEPELDVDGSVLRLSIRFPFLAEMTIAGEKRVVCKLYRRDIDEQADTTYVPAIAPEDGTEPTWTVDPKLTVAHGLGFCPVVWYAHMKGCSVVKDVDGKAIHATLTDEIRALDFALSQRHRAALYSGDPQWTEIGVKKGYNPTGDGRGRTAEMPASMSGGFTDQPHAMYVSGAPAEKARRKSPGDVWQYDVADASKVKVELHTLPGDALMALDNHCKDLLAKLSKGMGVVFIDAESLPNESRLSGRALESFKAPQLARVDCYRSDFGDHCMLPSLGMVLRIALESKMPLEGLDVVRSEIAKQPLWSWHAPSLSLLWGDYFKPSGEEEFQIIQGAALAKESGIAPLRALVSKLRGILEIKDIDAAMEQLATEQEDAQAKQVEMVQAEAKATAAARPKPAAGGSK